MDALTRKKRKRLPRGVFYNESEAVIQAQVATWLDFRGLLWCHVPNGEWRAISTARRLKKQGLRPGVPDILIFTPPPVLRPDGLPYAGCALELKRERGGKLSDTQAVWLDALQALGWFTIVGRGLGDTILALTAAGY